MPIYAGDIKLLKSAVMADVPEGGGAPTGNAIEDGTSNAIFPDISSTDRAGGRVSMRKVSAAVHADNVDTFFGANVIVAEPPKDPLVSVTIFETRDTFDQRSDAQSRVESYLAMGSRYNGLLFGQHLTGMMTVVVIQPQDRTLPAVGSVLVLLKNAGLVTEFEQYVRITAVSSQVLTFTDGAGDFVKRVVTCEISDPLRADFSGFDATRADASVSYSGKTELYNTIVANAARYYSVRPLAQAAALGDFGIKVDTVYANLIPSAQAETPIADARTNGRSGMLVSAGDAVTLTTVHLTPTQNVYIGGAIVPGSITATSGSVTITDNGGVLLSAGVQMGAVDYANGIMTATTDVFGGAGAMTVTYTPAAVPITTAKSVGVPITVSNRSLTHVLTLSNVARASLAVSYLAGGNWYVLRDNGGGAVIGDDTAFGTGVINYTTNTLTLTLGALPDVGGVIVVQWSEAATAETTTPIALQNAAKMCAEITAGEAISPNTLTLEWDDGGTLKTATDNGMGGITGDATGTVDYKAGVILFAPATLPPHGTVIDMTPDAATQTIVPAIANVTATAGTGFSVSGSLGGPCNASSVRIVQNCECTLVEPAWSVPGAWQVVIKNNLQNNIDVVLTDDGIGNLTIGATNVGSINYTTGAVTYTIDATHLTGATLMATRDVGRVLLGLAFYRQDRVLTSIQSIAPPVTIGATFTASGPSPKALSHTLTQLFAAPQYQPANYALQGVSFNLGINRFVATPAGQLVRDPDSATGIGVAVGAVAASSGRITLSSWAAGTPTEITNFRAVQAPPTDGAGTVSADTVIMFRTATAPLRPASLQVLGTMLDGTSINVTANANGEINTSRVKGRVDVDTGVVQLVFCNPSATAYGTTDATFLGISGVTTVNADIVRPETLRYNAVAYAYIPLDADLLGIDPVRLPTDGRVPIYRKGGFLVVGHTGRITASVSNGQTINCARVRLSRVRIIGNDGVVISTGYTTDLDAGTVTFTNVSGYSQPVTVEHRIEDMALVRDVQISGDITLTRPLTHDYPIAGVGEDGAFVSSALVAGDLFARVSSVYDQQTWTNVWSDDLIGTAATGTFNHALYPITVTNRGSITERWLIRFTNSTAYDVIGEHVGVIATGNTGADCAPDNPATGVPYFTIPALGWGAGWVAGNCLRVNTVGAQAPIWVVRTVQQGPETVPDDSFTLLIRGDVDRP